MGLWWCQRFYSAWESIPSLRPIPLPCLFRYNRTVYQLKRFPGDVFHLIYALSFFPCSTVVHIIATVLQLVLGYPLAVMSPRPLAAIISSLRGQKWYFGELITQINLQPLIDVISGIYPGPCFNWSFLKVQSSLDSGMIDIDNMLWRGAKVDEKNYLLEHLRVCGQNIRPFRLRDHSLMAKTTCGPCFDVGLWFKFWAFSAWLF